MAATVWKGYITFGLISIPVRLYTAARNERVSFHMIHAVCNTRIKQQLFCPHCDRTVDRSEIVKGYEINKGQWVVVEEDEIKKIAPQSTDTMDILEFVRLSDVDPIYFDASYYVVIRPREQGMTLHTIFYPNEVRAVPEYTKIETAELKPQEVQLAEQLVKSLAGPFEPGRYEDEYQKKLLELIEAKGEGKTVHAAAHKKMAPVVDLMAALQKSLGQAGERKPAAKAAPAAHGKSRRTATKRAAS
jgi:DNA end-binding protein Ku